MFAAVRELRRTRYDVAIDLQGLIKSAVIARMSGAARVIGFSARHLRERLARLFYTEVHDPGGGGIRDRASTRHVVQINLGLLARSASTQTAAEFPIWTMRRRRLRRRCGRRPAAGTRCSIPGAAWPNKRWPPERLAAVACALRERHGLRSVVLWGPASAIWPKRWSPPPEGRRCLAADNVDRRRGGARARRRGHGVGRHRSDAHRRGGRHADRRHLRPDASRAQRAVAPGDITVSRADTASVIICAAAGARRCACSTSRRQKCSTRSSAGLRPSRVVFDLLARLRARLGLAVRRRRVLVRAADAPLDRAAARRSPRWAKRCGSGRPVTAQVARGDRVGTVSLVRASAVCRLVRDGRRPRGRVGQRRRRPCSSRSTLSTTITAAMRTEEAFLRRRFGDAYRRVQGRTRRGGHARRFSFRAGDCERRASHRSPDSRPLYCCSSLKATYNGLFWRVTGR